MPARSGPIRATPQATEAITWSEVLPLFLAGQMEADGRRNLDTYPDYFRNTLEPMWHKVAKGDAVVQMVPLNPAGKTDLAKINPGTYQVIVTAKTDNAFYVWWEAPVFKASSNLTSKFNTDTAGFGIDLDARPAAPAPTP